MCLSALYWSPNPVSERYRSPHNSLHYNIANESSNVLWFTHVNFFSPSFFTHTTQIPSPSFFFFFSVQISDIHIGKGSNKLGERLEEFLSSELQTIQPEFTVVTGDITNSLDRKFSFFVRAKQQQDEWK